LRITGDILSPGGAESLAVVEDLTKALCQEADKVDLIDYVSARIAEKTKTF